jgi:hypothetical protein
MQLVNNNTEEQTQSQGCPRPEKVTLNLDHRMQSIKTCHCSHEALDHCAVLEFELRASCLLDKLSIT